MMDAIMERVMVRFEALTPEQRTVEGGWERLVFQEVLRECADFLAKAVVEEFLKEFLKNPRWRWKERSRFVRLLNRRIGCLR
jgi:hypothetical protein